VLRANSVPDALVGITLNLASIEGNTDSQEDSAAAKRMDATANRWFLDPIFRGRYPERLPMNASLDLVPIRDGDLEQISVPIDFLGVNNYFRTVVKAGPTGDGSDDQMVKPEFAEYTTMGWEVYPDGLYNLLTRLQRDYQPPAMYITENGAAFKDTPDEDGKVHDPRRENYLRLYLRAAHRAVADGVKLQGYFAWSLLDNFEWAHGYAQRFGITYVDYPTQRRVIKSSGRWYARAIAANGPID
jgi:beta-glucosidase